MDIAIEARSLVERHESATAGLWPRAAAALARQALELSMSDLWLRRAPGLESCTLRAQLLCLDEYLQDSEAAAGAWQAWVALSSACHQRPSRIEPTAEELRYWIGMVERFIEAVEARSQPRGDRGRDGRPDVA